MSWGMYEEVYTVRVNPECTGQCFLLHQVTEIFTQLLRTCVHVSVCKLVSEICGA